jgi:hypothetical protein
MGDGSKCPGIVSSGGTTRLELGDACRMLVAVSEGD